MIQIRRTLIHRKQRRRVTGDTAHWRSSWDLCAIWRRWHQVNILKTVLWCFCKTKNSIVTKILCTEYF